MSEMLPMHAVPRRLLLTLRLGEMPQQMPAWAAHARYGVPLAQGIDGGIIDRLLRHYGGALRCARLHSARRSRTTAITGARRFDGVEQLSGVARVLRIEVQQDGQLHDLVRALRQVPSVQSALVEHLSFSHLEAAHLEGAPLSQAWQAHAMIRLPQALGYTRGDPAVVIGLADTGVQLVHPGLPQSAWRRGFDAVDLSAMALGSLQLVGDVRTPDADPSDEVGHGTGCAGILRADGLGLPPGAAGLCSVLPVRVLGSAISGTRRVGVGSIANIDAGMKRLVDLGAKVINMSFGTAQSQLPEGGDLPHLEVVRYALDRGVILVAASGNSGHTERYFPAAHPGVIAVGAVNGRGEVSTFSTRGEHVAVCAPGEGIWTCGLGDAAGGQTALARVNGTSFAAPFVSAACGLLVARAESRAAPLDAALAAQLLRASCRAHVQSNTEGCGSGVLDVWAALQALDAHLDDAFDDDSTPLDEEPNHGNRPT
jgi:subtilisin family serine protease